MSDRPPFIIVMETARPALATECIGRVNATRWQRGRPGTWLCYGGRARRNKRRARRPHYTLELFFEHRAAGHTPAIIHGPTLCVSRTYEAADFAGIFRHHRPQRRAAR